MNIAWYIYYTTPRVDRLFSDFSSSPRRANYPVAKRRQLLSHSSRVTPPRCDDLRGPGSLSGGEDASPHPGAPANPPAPLRSVRIQEADGGNPQSELASVKPPLCDACGLAESEMCSGCLRPLRHLYSFV